MRNYSNHFILSDATLKDGLIAINQFIDEILCLFVVDKTQRLVGTLTNGDILRALISGVLLTETIEAAMKKDFTHVKIDEVTPNQIKNYRAKSIKLLPYIDEDGKLSKCTTLLQSNLFYPLMQCLWKNNFLII